MDCFIAKQMRILARRDKYLLIILSRQYYLVNVILARKDQYSIGGCKELVRLPPFLAPSWCTFHTPLFVLCFSYSTIRMVFFILYNFLASWCTFHTPLFVYCTFPIVTFRIVLFVLHNFRASWCTFHTTLCVLYVSYSTICTVLFL